MPQEGKLGKSGKKMNKYLNNIPSAAAGVPPWKRSWQMKASRSRASRARATRATFNCSAAAVLAGGSSNVWYIRWRITVRDFGIYFAFLGFLNILVIFLDFFYIFSVFKKPQAKQFSKRTFEIALLRELDVVRENVGEQVVQLLGNLQCFQGGL
jgi:hypothetical protein